MKRTYQREWAYKKRRAAAASASFTAVDEQDDQDDQGQCDQDQNDQIDLLDPNDLSEENDFLDQNEQDNQDPDEIYSMIVTRRQRCLIIIMTFIATLWILKVTVMMMRLLNKNQIWLLI